MPACGRRRRRLSPSALLGGTARLPGLRSWLGLPGSAASLVRKVFSLPRGSQIFLTLLHSLAWDVSARSVELVTPPPPSSPLRVLIFSARLFGGPPGGLAVARLVRSPCLSFPPPPPWTCDLCRYAANLLRRGRSRSRPFRATGFRRTSPTASQTPPTVQRGHLSARGRPTHAS